MRCLVACTRVAARPAVCLCRGWGIARAASGFAAPVPVAPVAVASAWGRRIWQSGLRGRRRLGALFPAIQGCAADIKGITGRGCVMIREETEDFEAFLSMFGSHLPKMP